MLVLTRKVDEGIRIGDDIEIFIIRIMENSVRIGITAPRDVNIARNELIKSPKVVGQRKESESK